MKNNKEAATVIPMHEGSEYEEQRIKILNSDDLYGVMQRVLLREDKIDRDKEHFWTVVMFMSIGLGMGE